jgi:hypothetical protein
MITARFKVSSVEQSIFNLSLAKDTGMPIAAAITCAGMMSNAQTINLALIYETHNNSIIICIYGNNAAEYNIINYNNHRLPLWMRDRIVL